MPIVEINEYLHPHVVYDAPVNEKTQKIREMFKVGENGYPEHYQWKGLARLGPKYDYHDPFLKFEPAEPKELISQKVTIVGGVTLISAGIHFFFAYTQRRPLWTRLYQFAGMVAVGTASGLWIQKKTFERQSRKFGIVIDYARKHPERFGEVKRYKLREVLLPYFPVR